jgi:hypothetical protein
VIDAPEISSDDAYQTVLDEKRRYRKLARHGGQNRDPERLNRRP